MIGPTTPGPDWPAGWARRRRYLPWRGQQRPNGTLSKVPVGRSGAGWQAVNPLAAPHWMSWEAAWRAVQAGHADGVGLAITRGIELTAIDLDHCVHDGILTPHAQAVLSVFGGAYTEVSPSGTGLHVLVRGACPPGWRRRDGYEVIDHGFITVTGRAWQAAASPLPDHAAILAPWHNALEPAVPPRDLSSPVTPPAAAPRDLLPTDRHVIARASAARNGATFQALWAGGLAGYPSRSEGDLALVMLLEYWLCPLNTDAALDRLFRASGRMRPKWDQQIAGQTYAQRTIHHARRVRAGGLP